MPMPGQPSFPRDYLPAGEYVFRVSFIYLQDGIEKEILIGSNTVTLNENQQHEINLSFPIAKNLHRDWEHHCLNYVPICLFHSLTTL